ncbi:hypothetical protein EON63_16760 [archaeon]|nr:MAG: hypothetical protein EON63_16760 [archaeon]
MQLGLLNGVYGGLGQSLGSLIGGKGLHACTHTHTHIVTLTYTQSQVNYHVALASPRPSHTVQLWTLFSSSYISSVKSKLIVYGF